MSVDYDRTFCETFVDALKRTINHRDLLQLWQAFCFSEILEPSPYVLTMPGWRIWVNLSLWNKQGILFLLAPEIEKMSREFAMSFAQKARIHEPL